MIDSVNSEYRPLFHLTPPIGWMNDPVGFIHWNGAWHLFYQHYPHAPHWGAMHWGHARSTDLVNWEHLPIALIPDSPWNQGGCFSGSSLESSDGSLLLMYTNVIPAGDGARDQVQCTAVSTDGLYFEKTALNPVIGKEQIPAGSSLTDFRDPRMILHDGTTYVLIASHDCAGHGQVLFYRSQDFTVWEFVNILFQGNDLQGNIWECPDMFTLEGCAVLMVSPMNMPPDGDAYHNLHSVMALTGAMDWEHGSFSPTSQQPLDWGFDFYAAQTAMAPDGRRILVAWMDTWDQPYPTADLGHGWAGAMTLPRELTLKNGWIYSQPIRELQLYRKNTRAWAPFTLTDSLEINTIECSFEFICEILPNKAGAVGISFLTGPTEETRLVYNPKTRILQLDRSDSGHGTGGTRQVTLDRESEHLHLQIVIDRSSLEVFINHGQYVMSTRIYPRENCRKVRLWSQGKCDIMKLKLWDLEV